MPASARELSEDAVTRLMTLVSDVDVLELMREIGRSPGGFVPYRGAPDEFSRDIFRQICASNSLSDRQTSAARALSLPRNWLMVRELIAVDRIPVTEEQITVARTRGAPRPSHTTTRGRRVAAPVPLPAPAPTPGNRVPAAGYVARRAGQEDTLGGLAAVQEGLNVQTAAIRAQQSRTDTYMGSSLDDGAAQKERARAKQLREEAAKAYQQKLKDEAAAKEAAAMDASERAVFERFKRLELDDYAPVPMPEDQEALARFSLVMREVDGPLPSVSPPGKRRAK